MRSMANPLYLTPRKMAIGLVCTLFLVQEQTAALRFDIQHGQLMANNYRSCLTMGAISNAFHAPTEIKPECLDIFANRGEVVRLAFDNDKTWIRYISEPISKQALHHLYNATLLEHPEMGGSDLPPFELWWTGLPVGDQAPQP